MNKEEEIDYEKQPLKEGDLGEIKLEQHLTEEESDEIREGYAKRFVKTLR